MRNHIIALILIFCLLVAGCTSQQVNPSKELTYEEQLKQVEASCTGSGGTVSAAPCCLSAGDFPDTCAIGACGCGPGNTHSVKFCQCGEGNCFDGNSCVPLQQPGQQVVGGDTDSHGCKPSAGYTWCDPLQKCLRLWEENCTANGSTMSLNDAVKIAGNSDCVANASLTTTAIYNPNSKTWWIDLLMNPGAGNDMCHPACVVYEDTGKAEINWRCTGAIIPQK